MLSRTLPEGDTSEPVVELGPIVEARPILSVEGGRPEPADQRRALDPGRMHVDTQCETGAAQVANMRRGEHWGELVEHIIVCPGLRLPIKPANGVGVGRAPRKGGVGREEAPDPGLADPQSPPPIIPRDLPEGDGMIDTMSRNCLLYTSPSPRDS